MRDFNHLVVELVADQDIAISELHGPRRQRRRIAARSRVREEVPEIRAVLVGFHDAAVVGIRNERVAVGKPARKGQAAEGHAAGSRVCVHDGARHGVCDLQCLVVVLVGDEDVAGHQKLGGIWIIQPVVFPHDGFI